LDTQQKEAKMKFKEWVLENLGLVMFFSFLFLVAVIIGFEIFNFPPYPSMITSGSLISFLVLIYCILYVYSQKRKYKYIEISTYIRCAFSVVASFVITAVIYGLLFITMIPGNSIIIDENANYVASFEHRAWLWDNDKLLANTKTCSYKQEDVMISFTGPHAVTANPKVRNIAYSIKLVKFGSPQKFIAHIKTVENFGGDTENWLAYWLYEFNEAKSKELSKFYNPKDNEQQLEFLDLLLNFLGPQLLQARVKLSDARFFIPQ